jgi:hypothetical protein
LSDVFFGSIRDRILITEILSAPGGEKLTSEALQIIAVLAMEKRPYYVGDRNEPREFPRDSVNGIVKSLGKCHSVTQGLIRDQAILREEMDRRLKRIKLVLGTLNAFLATVAAVLALLKFL